MQQQTQILEEQQQPHHICPWWIGYLLASPLRRLLQRPEQILSPYLQPGDTALDFGCAMGFFSAPMAHLVGLGGEVICADVQQRMLDTLDKRLRKARVNDVARSHLVTDAPLLGLPRYRGKIDFVLAFAVVHEVPDPAALMRSLHQLMAPGARLLLAEPAGHVTDAAFAQELRHAVDAGMVELEPPPIRRSLGALLQKPNLP